MTMTDDTKHVAGEMNDAGTERDEKGRFRKGNGGGPGNPFARQSAKLRKAAMDAVSEEDISEIFVVLKRKTKEGDVAAIKLLLAYTVGKPADAVNPDTLDEDEIASLLRKHASTPEMMTQILEGMPADMLLVVLRAVLPLMQQQKLAMAQEYLQPPVDEEEADAKVDAVAADVGELPQWRRELIKQPADSTPGAGKVDAAMLAILLERMRGLSSKEAAGPSGNRLNGGAGPERTQADGEAEVYDTVGNGCNGQQGGRVDGAWGGERANGSRAF